MTQEEKQSIVKWCEKKKKEFRWYPLTMNTIINGNPNESKIKLLDELLKKYLNYDTKRAPRERFMQNLRTLLA